MKITLETNNEHLIKILNAIIQSEKVNNNVQISKNRLGSEIRSGMRNDENWHFMANVIQSIVAKKTYNVNEITPLEIKAPLSDIKRALDIFANDELKNIYTEIKGTYKKVLI